MELILSVLVILCAVPVTAQIVGPSSSVSDFSSADTRYVNSPVESVAQTFTSSVTISSNVAVAGATLVTANGNVGIGTGNPLTQFVISNDTVTYIRINNTRNASWDGTENIGGIQWFTNDISGGGVRVMSSLEVRNKTAGTAPSGDFVFNTFGASEAAQEKMRLNFSGNLGLGTPTPDQKLTVAGNISLTGNVISSGTGSNYFAGKVGISSTTPAAQLGVTGGIIATSSVTAQGGMYDPTVTSGFALCINASKRLSVCSNTPAADGSCTCN